MAQDDILHSELGGQNGIGHWRERVPGGFKRLIDDVFESGQGIIAQLVFDQAAGALTARRAGLP